MGPYAQSIIPKIPATIHSLLCTDRNDWWFFSVGNFSITAAKNDSSAVTLKKHGTETSQLKIGHLKMTRVREALGPATPLASFLHRSNVREHRRWFSSFFHRDVHIFPLGTVDIFIGRLVFRACCSLSLIMFVARLGRGRLGLFEKESILCGSGKSSLWRNSRFWSKSARTALGDSLDRPVAKF